MIPPHSMYQIYHSLSLRDNCTPPKCGELSEYTDSAHTEVEDPSLCMTDAGTTQDNFILPTPPVGGLPISQDWLDRMKLVYDSAVPIVLPSGKDILVDYIILN